MRVLVTGAAGFLGGHVVEALRAAGHETDAPGVSGPRVDLADPAAVENWLGGASGDGLVHAAWYGGDDRIQSPENARWVDHTRALLDGFAAAGGRRVVTLGTCFEYALGDGVLAEDATPIEPHTPYGRAKADVAQLVAARNEAGSLSGVHARVGYLYGPGETPPRLVPALVETLAAGRRFASTSGVQRRDYLHVHDAARAIVRLVEADIEGPVNVGSGHAIPVAELINAVARELGAEDLLDLGALPIRPGDPDVIELSIQRLVGLGWHPEIDLSDGVRGTVRSMLPPSPEKATTR